MFGAAIFAVLVIVVIVLLARNTSAVMYALIAYTPMNQLLPGGLFYRGIPEMLRIAAFIGVVILCALRGRPFLRIFWGDRLTKAVLLWYVAILVSFVNSGSFTPWSERTMVRFTSYACLYFAIRGWILQSEQLWKCWKTISYVIAFCGLFGMLQMAMGGPTPIFTILHLGIPANEWEGRTYSIVAAGVNAFGGMMCVLIPFQTVLYFNAPSRAMRLKHGAILGVGVLAAIFSGSRGALMGIFVGIVLACIYLVRQKKTRLMALGTLLVGLPVLVVMVTLLSPRLTQVDKSDSVYKRYEIWDQALGMYREHPILGIGMGNFRENYDADKLGMAQALADVHNLYLQNLTETGIVGLCVFLWMCGELYWKGFRDLNRYRMGSIRHGMAYVTVASTVAMMIHGTVDSLFVGSTEFGAAFMVMMALASRYNTLQGPELLAPLRRASN